LNGFGFGTERVRGSELVEENLRVAADHGEQIIEIVSDSSRDGRPLPFLRLTKLRLRERGVL